MDNYAETFDAIFVSEHDESPRKDKLIKVGGRLINNNVNKMPYRYLTDSGSLCNSLVAGTCSRQQSGFSDFKIRLKFRTKRYSSDGLSRIRSGPFLQAACDFQQGGSTHICLIVLLTKITNYDILSAC